MSYDVCSSILCHRELLKARFPFGIGGLENCTPFCTQKWLWSRIADADQGNYILPLVISTAKKILKSCFPMKASGTAALGQLPSRCEGPQSYFLTPFVSRPFWCSTILVTSPFSFLTNSICASTSFRKNMVSDSANIGTFPWFVPCEINWPSSSVIARLNLGVSSYVPTYFFKISVDTVISFLSVGSTTFSPCTTFARFPAICPANGPFRFASTATTSLSSGK